MITIKIYLRKHVKDATSGIVWISFYVNREKVNFSTKVCVEEKNWSEKKQRVTNNDKLADDKNLIIENILARINNVFVKYRLKDNRLTRDSFFRAYNRPDDYDTFFDYIKAKFKNLRMELGTYCSHQSAISKLMLYSPALHFDDIDVRFLDLYFSYLKKECENNDNTAYKNMAILKKIHPFAFKDGYLDENPFDEWKIRKVKSNYEEECGCEIYQTNDKNGHFFSSRYIFDDQDGEGMEYFDKPETLLALASRAMGKKIETIEELNDAVSDSDGFSFHEIKVVND